MKEKKNTSQKSGSQKEYGYAGERDQTNVQKGEKYPHAQNEPKAKLNYTAEKAACKTLSEIRTACEKGESPLLCYFDNGAEKSREIINTLKGAGYKRENVKHTDVMYSTWIKQ